MRRSVLLQRVAAGWCLLVAALLTVYQFAPGFGHPPTFLYVLFTGVWLFGAAMLWLAPVFGGVGTALYGVMLGAQLLMTHATRAQNVVLAAASFAGAALAVAFLVARGRDAP
jgi:hypothetical protein